MAIHEPEWIRLTEALRRYDAVISYSEPMHGFGRMPDGIAELKRVIQSERNRAMTAAAASGEIKFKGAPGAAMALRDITTEHFRLNRAFSPDNEILACSADGQNTEEYIDAHKNTERHPTWIDVVAHRASIDDWLKTVRSAILQPASRDLSRLPDKQSLTLAETLSFLAFGVALERERITEWCDPSFEERQRLIEACFDEARDKPELAHWPKVVPADLDRLLWETLFEERTPKPWPPSATRLRELAIEQNPRNHHNCLRLAVAEALLHKAALDGKLQVTGIREGQHEHEAIGHHAFAHGYHLDWLSDRIERGIFDGEDRETWTEVFLERESLIRSLGGPLLRDWLIGELKYGRIELEPAREQAHSSGILSLEGNPAPEEFDPMAETYWTPAMAVAWLAWQSPDEVRKQWIAFKVNCFYFHHAKWRIGIVDEIHEGWLLANCPRPSVTTLFHDEESLARATLKKFLERGILIATGVPERGGKRVEIPAREWQDLEFFLEHGSDVARAESTLAAGYEAITVASASVIALCAASPQVEGKQSSPAHGAGKPGAEAPAVATKAQLEAAYKERRDRWPTDGDTPSLNEDWAFLKTLHADLPRHRAIKIRDAHAPEKWKRPGRPKAG